jgi:hypothetical protein
MDRARRAGLSAEPGKVTLWKPQVQMAHSIGDPKSSA